MVGLIVTLFSIRCFRSRLIFRVLIRITRLWYRKTNRHFSFESDRFERATWIANFVETESGSHHRSMEIVIVSASKDFDILSESLNFAVNAVSSYQLDCVRVIVPNRDVAECQTIFLNKNFPLKVVSENEYISHKYLKQLTKKFNSRDTWVLQQLLKIQAVLTSKADAVLIVDSDTILLRSRPWFSHDGEQILMPSTEYYPPYYRFLQKLNLSDLVPQYSFVSHHMLVQPIILNRLLSSLNLLPIDSLITYICKNAETDVDSPVSVDYELYGQFLTKSEPKIYFFERWSNISISRRYAHAILKSTVAKFILRKFYNSISFHSWS